LQFARKAHRISREDRVVARTPGGDPLAMAAPALAHGDGLCINLQ
jgi:hypothetical protein